jgi:hypothetical protein
MKAISYQFPEAIFGKEKTILVRDIVTFSSIDELKESVINDEIDKAQRENFETQVHWIIQKTNMDDFTSHYPGWSSLLELFERRNLFIHSNGIVNGYYLKASKKHNFPASHNISIGHELHAGPKYFTASIREVIQFGAMLSQVVWRKLAPSEVAMADKSISDLGYELIAREEYKLAIKILEFAKNLRGVSEEVRKRMNIVNLANAYKLSGDEKNSLSVLSSMDWSAVAPNFKISVAAVKGDVDQVVELMQKMGKHGDMPAANYQQWPVFYTVRDDPRFMQSFKSVFGLDYVPSSRGQAGLPQVLEWIKQRKEELEAESEENPELIDDPVTIQSKADNG